MTPEPIEADEPWWRRSVVYEVYCRSFADSNGDGIGDLEGLRRRLDYLVDLGVEVIWLSPVCRSPDDDNGYDISDYQDIDPRYGTLADFDRLLADVHGRKMRLIMDLVVNHTSDEHPWFTESRAAPDSPKRDWYWWRGPRPGRHAGETGAEPSNWASFFGGPAWELDPTTGEYCLHLFSRKQPDLRWEQPAVRQAVYAMMRWWLDRGVDGFRMDVINLIAKDPRLPDGPAGADGLGDATPFVMGRPQVHAWLQEMYQEVFADRPRLLTVGETPGVSVEEARLFTDPTRHELDMVFQFEHVNLDQGASKWDVRPLRLADLKASLGRWQAGLADVGWNSLYWSNHDQPRAVSRFGDDGAYRVRSAKLLATVLHLHRGTPYVYQGEELGMADAAFPSIEAFRDIEARNHYATAVAAGQAPEDVLAGLRTMGRDTARTPMPWDASDNAGFTTGRPWIDVDADYRSVNAEAAMADPDSVYHHYRALIALRRSEPAVVYGDFTMLVPDDERIYAFTRRWGDVELLVIANLSGDTVPSPIEPDSPWDHASLILANERPGNTAAPHDTLDPWEARLYRRAV